VTDEELARYLGVSVAAVVRLTERERKAYERLYHTELGVKMWLRGEGPKPPGVIVCDARRRQCR